MNINLSAKVRDLLWREDYRGAVLEERGKWREDSRAGKKEERGKSERL